MRLEITAIPGAGPHGEHGVRATIFNDSYEPVPVSRNAFVGPTEVALTASGMPLPESVEATHGASDEPMTLQPFTFYGRERWFELAPGDHEFTTEYRTTDTPLRASAIVTVTEAEAGGS